MKKTKFLNFIKKRSLLIVILITIIYTIIIKYNKSNELHLNEIIGYSLGLLLLSFLISLICGLFDFARKKFSWVAVKNTFVIVWLFFAVISILFSAGHGGFNKKDDAAKLKVLVKQYASELNSQRKVYHYKISEIGATDIKRSEDIKNINFLKNLKHNINRQKEVEDSNYQTVLILYGKWLEKFENFQKNHNNSVTKNMIFELKENTKKSLKRINEMKQLQHEYFTKYNKDIDFLISENDNITIKNNNLFFKDETVLYRYNQIQTKFYNAAKLYIDYLSIWKTETVNNVKYFNNKYFNFQEIDTLIDMTLYNKY